MVGAYLAYMGFERGVYWERGQRGLKSEEEEDRPLRWEVMWSRLAQDVPQSFHLQVRERLFVDFLPM